MFAVQNLNLRMKNYFNACLLIAILLPFSALSSITNEQAHKIDSVRNIIKSSVESNDLFKAKDCYSKLSNFYEDQGLWVDYEQLIDEMFALAKRNGDIDFEAECYNKLGISNCLNGNNTKSLECFTKALELNIIQHDTVAISNSYENIGLVYKDLGQYNKALEFQHKSLLIREIINHPRLINTYLNIATVYSLLGNSSMHFEYLKRALAYSNSSKIKNTQSAILNNELAKYYNDNGQIDSALICYQNVVDFSKEDGWLKGMAVGMGNIAEIYQAQGKYDLALEKHRESLSLSLKLNDCMSIAEQYLFMSVVFNLTNKVDSALVYANNSLLKSEECSLAKERQNALQYLSELYEEKKDYEKALAYNKLYNAQKDSILNIDKFTALSEIESKYQNEAKTKEILLLSARENLVSQQRVYLFVIAIILLSLVIMLFFISNYRKKINTQMRTLDSVKTSFFNNISHEFRTPLTLIEGPLYNLLKIETNPQKRKDIEGVIRNSRRLLMLVNQVLDISKIDTGKYKLQLEYSDLGQFLNVIIEPFRYLAKQENLSFSSHVDDTGYVWFDPKIIDSVVLNLLSNAIKYCTKEGSVDVLFSHQNNEAFFQVVNSSDILPEHLEKSFDRYYQNNPNSPGTGIGLALSKELAQIYRARLFSQKRADDTVLFSLTFSTDKQSYNENEISDNDYVTSTYNSNINSFVLETEIEHQKHEGNKPIILVVEDNKDMRTYIRRCFSDDYTIIEASNGNEGLQLAIDKIPDLIISDVMMPEMDGFELCKSIRADFKTTHIPVVLLTAKSDQENRIEGLRTGANDYLSKPFNAEELIIKVENILRFIEKQQKLYKSSLDVTPLKINYSTAEEDFAKSIQEVLNNHLHKADFNIEQFCSVTHMSRTQLHRKVKALTGYSATAFIRQQRVKVAAELLKEPGNSISNVCYSTGFNDPSYFSKCFKEFMGCSPTEYISQHLN